MQEAMDQWEERQAAEAEGTYVPPTLASCVTSLKALLLSRECEPAHSKPNGFYEAKCKTGSFRVRTDLSPVTDFDSCKTAYKAASVWAQRKDEATQRGSRYLKAKEEASAFETFRAFFTDTPGCHVDRDDDGVQEALEEFRACVHEYPGNQNQVVWDDSLMACSSQAQKLTNAITRTTGGTTFENKSGAFRSVVFPNRRCVIKVARHENGAAANKAEMQTWETVVGTGMKGMMNLFAPISEGDVDGLYLVQARASPDPTALTKVKTELRKVGIVCGDVHDGNVGYIGKRPVVFDYGNETECILENTPTNLQHISGFPQKKHIALRRTR